MFEDVEEKRKKKNKLFFSRTSPCLEELVAQMDKQDHTTMIMWSLDCARHSLTVLENKFPDEKRPRICVDLCEAWALGKIKMPLAKKAILASHAAAREMEEKKYELLCRGIAHAGATVHVASHAIGLPIYELTYLVHNHGSNYTQPVTEKILFYQERLLYWQEQTKHLDVTWAPFIKN